MYTYLDILNDSIQGKNFFENTRKTLGAKGFNENAFLPFHFEIIARIDSGMRVNTLITEQYYSTHV